MEKVKYIEGGRKWNSTANEKQYLHQMKLRHICVEDMRTVLETHFGSRQEVFEKIEEVVRKGEKEIDDRIKMLRMADKVSWLAVDKYVADLLYKDEENDKKWKAAVKEAKEE